MAKMYLTDHCKDNIKTLFSGLITEAEILDKVCPNYGWRRHYTVKVLPRVIRIQGPRDVKIGDSFVAIVEDERIVNVILRCRSQYSEFYKDARLESGGTYHNFNGRKHATRKPFQG